MTNDTQRAARARTLHPIGARIVAFILCWHCSVWGEELTIFAAASLTEPLEQLSEQFRRESGFEPRLSFAASSTLAKQIEYGAPANIYFSANRAWMDYLVARRLVARATVTHPLSNTLVAAARLDSTLSTLTFDATNNIDTQLDTNARIAVGDPQHVPAGIYTRQALQRLGWWPSLAPRLARTDNTRAALALIERGETPLGFIYRTDALSSRKVKVLAELPGELHDPIIYSLALVRGQDSTAADAFYRYLLSDHARAVFERYGFRWQYVE